MKQTKIQHFMIDPPWPLGKVLRYGLVNSELSYKTISTQEMFKLVENILSKFAAKQHHVYLWSLDKYLVETDIEMEKLGYKRHLRIIWDKKKRGSKSSINSKIMS